MKQAVKGVTLMLVAMATMIVSAYQIEVAGGSRNIEPDEIVAISALQAGEVVVKIGSGELIVPTGTDLSGCAADFIISNGTWTVSSNKALGRQGTSATSRGSSVTVEAGGQLKLADTTDNAIDFKYRDVVLAGSGPDGNGAIYKSGTGNDWNSFHYCRYSLTADTTIKTTGYQFFIINSEMDLGGHVLTLTGAKGASISSTAMKSSAAGGKLVASSGNLRLLGTTSFAVENDPVIEVGTGASVYLNGIQNPVTWKGVFADGTSLWTNSGNDEGVNCWSGDVVLNGTVVVNGSSNDLRINIRGKTSGTGHFQISLARVHFYGRETGLTSLVRGNGDWGYVYAHGVDTIPPLSACSNTGSLYLYYVGDDLTAEEARNLFVEYNKAGKQTNWSVSGEWTIPSGDYSSLSSVTVDKAAMSAHVSGTFASGVKMSVSSGKLSLSDVDGLCPVFDAVKGELRLDDSGFVYTGTAKIEVRNTYPSVAKVVVDGESVLAATSTVENAGLSQMYFDLGGDVNNSRGIVEVAGTAVVTNQLNAGVTYTDGRHSAGAVYLRDSGAWYSQYSMYYGGVMLGSKEGEGYFEVNDDAVFHVGSKNGEWLYVGTQNGVGVMDIKGGSFCKTRAGIRVANVGTSTFGVLRVSGGQLLSDGGQIGLCTDDNNTRSGGTGVLTIDAGVLSNTTKIVLGAMKDSLAVLNLNGGSLTAGSLIGALKPSDFSGNNESELSGNRKYVNFNGGTFVYPNAAGNVFSGTFTRMTSYGDGAIFDTAGQDRRFPYGIEAPADGGVLAIDYQDTVAWDHIGAPAVRIVDPSGSGSGATAYAIFDSTTGYVTGIEVTSPGQGYGEGTYAVLSRMGLTDEVTIAASKVTLGRPLSGGLTKKGTGTLTLVGANTYSGTTRIEAGVLKFGSAESVPSQTVYVLAGGNVDFNGYALGETDWRLSLGQTSSVPGDFAFPAGSQLTIDGLSGATEAGAPYVLLETTGVFSGDLPCITNLSELPKNMRIKRSGKRLMVDRQRGIVLMVR